MAIPITKECSTLTYPDAGVIPARPAIAPLTAATTEGLPVLSQDMPTHINAETEEAMCVTMTVFPASEPEASALPALNPNQPNQRSAEPVTANGMLCGTSIAGPKNLLRPSTIAAASAPIPTLV